VRSAVRSILANQTQTTHARDNNHHNPAAHAGAARDGIAAHGGESLGSGALLSLGADQRLCWSDLSDGLDSELGLGGVSGAAGAALCRAQGGEALLLCASEDARSVHIWRLPDAHHPDLQLRARLVGHRTVRRRNARAGRSTQRDAAAAPRAARGTAGTHAHASVRFVTVAALPLPCRRCASSAPSTAA
jgi:hypothetical protein